MPIEVPPKGEHGWEFPRLPRPMVAAMLRANLIVFRLFGRWLKVQGRPVLILGTMGARTGKQRHTPLGWFPDLQDRQDSWLIVASAAGSSRHPAWFLNLAKHPGQVSVRMNGQSFRVEPETLSGAELEAAWAQIATLAPGYDGYRKKTDRQIPVIRLKRQSSP